jgi:hypothetical protein
MHRLTDYEMRLIAAFFGNRKGYFVEVGANEPRARSQTFHLEQAGWTGILIEPQPQLAAQLHAERKAKVFAVACSSPENAGRMLPLHVAGPLSALDRGRMAPAAVPAAVIDVPVPTLDSVLEEAQAPAGFDFLSAAAHFAGRSRGRPVEASRPARSRLPHRAPLREQWLVCAARVRRTGHAFRPLGDRAQILPGAAVPVSA